MHQVLLNVDKHKHIRNFRYSDAEQCCGIINACLQKMDGINDAARSFLLRKNIPEILAAELLEYYSLVYEDKLGIMGVGSLDGSEINRMYVHPTVQGHGIGTVLLQHLVCEASHRHITTLHLHSSPSVESFYRQQEYKSKGSGHFAIETAVIHIINMEKELK